MRMFFFIFFVNIYIHCSTPALSNQLIHEITNVYVEFVVRNYVIRNANENTNTADVLFEEFYIQHQAVISSKPITFSLPNLNSAKEVCSRILVSIQNNMEALRNKDFHRTNTLLMKLVLMIRIGYVDELMWFFLAHLMPNF